MVCKQQLAAAGRLSALPAGLVLGGSSAAACPTLVLHSCQPSVHNDSKIGCVTQLVTVEKGMKTPGVLRCPAGVSLGGAQHSRRSEAWSIKSKKFKTGEIGTFTGCATDLAEAALADWDQSMNREIVGRDWCRVRDEQHMGEVHV